MALQDDLDQSTESLRNGSAGIPNASDGAPPDDPNANALPPPPAGSPPGPGEKPRLVEKLSKDPAEMSQETLQLMEDAKGDDDDAQGELQDMVMNAKMGLYCIMIGSKRPIVKLGHSLFKYMSSARKADPYHQHTIVFVGDRSPRGDPLAFAIPPKEAKKIGKWKEVKWDATTDKRKAFFDDVDNINKLYIPDKSVNLTKEKTPAFMMVGPKVALYVLSKRPSPANLEKWANVNLSGKEGELVKAWAAMAAQTKPGNKEARPASILAQDLEVVEEESKELQQSCLEHLDSTLGRAPQSPRSVSFQGGFGGSPRQESSDDSAREEREREQSDLMKKLTEAVVGKTSKTKLTSALKHKVSGYMGVDFDDPAVSAVAARWKELDDVRGDESATMDKVQEHLEEVGEELRVDPAGQLLPYDLIKDMLDGNFVPTTGLGDVLAEDFHKGFTCIRCAPYTPTERSEYKREQEAHKMSSGNVRFEEAKDMLAKKGKAPPNDYQAVKDMVAGFWRLAATYFGENSNLATDYECVYKLLKLMTNTHFEVSAASWHAFTWLASNNDCQYCNTRVTERQLMDGIGLPESNMRAIAQHLKTFKTVPRVVGMPYEWSNAGSSQKGKVVSRNKRERTWDDLSSDEGEERWRHPGGSEWDDQSHNHKKQQPVARVPDGCDGDR